MESCSVDKARALVEVNPDSWDVVRPEISLVEIAAMLSVPRTLIWADEEPLS